MTIWHRHANLFVRTACAAAALVGASGVHASDEDTPLFLTISQSVTRDSNFSRNAAQQPETVSTTTVGGGLNKAYGRQTYRLSGAIGASRYQNFEDLKNDSKRADGRFTSEFGRNFLLTLNGQYSEGLNPIQNNNNGQFRVVRNIRTFSGASAALQYGLGGRFSLVGTVEQNKQDFSADAYKFQNYDQSARGVRVLYNLTDTFQWGLGLRRVVSDYPDNRNEQVRDNNIDLSVGWQATGLSSLEAVLSRRNSDYAVSGRKLNTWVGSLNWEFTPRGLVTYNVGLSRSTGSDNFTNRQTFSFLGQNVLFDANREYNTITTSLNFSARYALTGKIGITGTVNYAKYDINNASTSVFDSGAVVDNGSVRRNSRFSQVSLAADYQALRSVKVGCNVTKYDQTANFFRVAFSGHSYGCNASLTLD